MRKYPGRPFAMFEPEKDRGDQKRSEEEFPQGHFFKVGLHQIAVKERAKKDFLKGRHHERGAEQAHGGKEPGRC